MRGIYIHIWLLACGLMAQAQVAGQEHPRAAEAQAAVEAVAADPALSQAVVSICAMSGDGRVIVDIDADNMLVPASNMKLISTGLALHHFGPEHRYETQIAYDGTITDGTLNGNIYIIGKGDPTLASPDSIAVNIEKVFALWTSFIKDAGIKKIEGRIIGDGRYFDGMIEEPTWLWNDIGTYYGAGATGLMFYENMQSFSAAAGAKVGDLVKIHPSYPDAPWMEFRYNCTTGDKGTGDMLFMYTSDLAPVAEIRGTFGVDRANKRVDCSNKFPEYTCARYFLNHLTNNGIKCEGGAGDYRLDTTWEPRGEMTVIGTTYSPVLERIAFETNHASNNLFAETLLRSLGREMTGSACYDSCYVAAYNIMKELKINTARGVDIQDGSGLSRQNYVSSDFFCRYLLAMMNSPHFETFAASLPSPGKEGTLLYNMKNYPASTRNRILVKSGSMNGVRCYSGYIIPTDGTKEETIIFSMMVNNCTSPTWKVRPLQDKIMGTLAGLN
ncbi:MAG: D-alanyl-D-alanine carboxypeptidase/D-alanyl-D-alanine-endopeptidase [Bacteroidales bacterium]|nr:D-alanyl-D-alanine carboxypeptidase/D-alanyl-D-alanine-endopeptidase [Bacteroidales bacterium]